MNVFEDGQHRATCRNYIIFCLTLCMLITMVDTSSYSEEAKLHEFLSEGYNKHITAKRQAHPNY